MNRALIHRRAQRLLPAGIETCGLLHFGMAPGQVERALLGSVFADERVQGVVALRLSLSTALAIRRKGLRYFEAGDWVYSAFAGTDSSGFGGEAGGAVAVDALPAGHGAGYSAVAQDGRSWFVVLPVERMVVYGWWE
ncbi:MULTISPECIES: hypothetical protein [Stenotrophomonas]|uniref:hypothetical protein n=1 Tax=Stenotrophomonas TaxID=40323 RepID=UPI0007703264|nr:MULTISPECIES: hypothetical protein [Stenotrophomonas]AMJ55826.1 hypothetical protein AXG53_03610 [Stenotrophomonas sp. KCTC 12332]